ncbi:MAG: hypothetical protein SWK76_07770, partial [Actinomycetota bacterium]|nr:hypothetical protein [Actinomycetota bacterium]
ARDGEVVCERAMYWNGRQGGHDSVGVTSPASQWYLAEGATGPGGGGNRVELTVQERAGVERVGEIVTSGIPLPQDFNVYSSDDLALFDADDSVVPCQMKITARWGGTPRDASLPAKWVLLDFPADVEAYGQSKYYLGRSTAAGNPPTPIAINDDGTTLTVDTGAAVFRLRRDAFDLFNGVELAGAGTVFTPSSANSFILEAGGKEYSSSALPPSSFQLEESGPMRASVTIRGSLASSSAEEFLHWTARIWFYSGSSCTRVFYTLENHNPIQPDGMGQPQCWDIGCPGSETFSGLVLRLVPDTDGPATATLDSGNGQGESLVSTGGDLSLYQDSSGSQWWDVHRGSYPRPQSYVTFRGWRAWKDGGQAGSGDRAQAWLDLSGGGRGMALGLKDFWQNHPKGLSSSGSEARLSLFPQEYGGDFTLRPGEHKTHEIHLYFHAGNASDTGVAETMSALQNPLMALASPQWYVESGTLGRATAVGDDPAFNDYEDQNRCAFDPFIGTTSYSLLQSIEENDFYGWCDYGDVPLDFEVPSGQMNLKYDFDFGMMVQFLRSGDYRWWDLTSPACRHIADVDILHYEGEIDHWADGGYFGHSQHAEPGNLNPHRNYLSPHPDLHFAVSGGLLYYYLTGYEEEREAAFEMVENTRYRFENSYGRGNGEGWAGCEDDYGHESFRPFANGLLIMTEAYQATGDQAYLSTAEWIIQCSHQASDPFLAAPQPGMGGGTTLFSLDLFNFSLGRYVDMITDADIPDGENARQYLVSLVRHEADNCWRVDGQSFQGYPYGWYFNGDADESFGRVNLCNWQLLHADCLAYAYIYGGGDDLLEMAGQAFRTGSERPNGEDTEPGYWSTKESVNSARFGLVYMSTVGGD